MPAVVQVKAPAKINLSLEVLGLREDGYHDVVTVLQALGLEDRITLETAEGMSLTCSAPELEVPTNLALRAAELLKHETGVRQGARIHIEKSIPVAAGLGGGSSDAAAILKGLSELWAQELMERDILSLAARLGSDVPFFIRGGTAYAEGRGEQVHPLPFPGRNWVLILAPPIVVEEKTRQLYSCLTPDDYTDGSRGRSLAQRLREGREVGVPFNVFQRVALDFYEGLPRYFKLLQAISGPTACLAGSGPALYALARDESQARQWARRLEGCGAQIYAAPFLPPEQDI